LQQNKCHFYGIPRQFLQYFCGLKRPII